MRNQFLIPAIESLKKTCQILCLGLEFFVREGLGCFSQPNVLPKVSKITDLLKLSKNEQARSILTCPKSEKWLSILNWSKSEKWQFENLYISSHGKVGNIKLVQQVNLIQRVQLGTPHQEVVTLLPHNHVTLTNLLYL